MRLLILSIALLPCLWTAEVKYIRCADGTECPIGKACCGQLNGLNECCELSDQRLNRSIVPGFWLYYTVNASAPATVAKHSVGGRVARKVARNRFRAAARNLFVSGGHLNASNSKLSSGLRVAKRSMRSDLHEMSEFLFGISKSCCEEFQGDICCPGSQICCPRDARCCGTGQNQSCCMVYQHCSSNFGICLQDPRIFSSTAPRISPAVINLFIFLLIISTSIF